MLALPVITGLGGFIPSLAMFVFAWLFMTASGFLLLEANLAIGHNLSLISIAERTLGKTGKLLCWILFIFSFILLVLLTLQPADRSSNPFWTIFLESFFSMVGQSHFYRDFWSRSLYRHAPCRLSQSPFDGWIDSFLFYFGHS